MSAVSGAEKELEMDGLRNRKNGLENEVFRAAHTSITVENEVFRAAHTSITVENEVFRAAHTSITSQCECPGVVHACIHADTFLCRIRFM